MPWVGWRCPKTARCCLRSDIPDFRLLHGQRALSQWSLGRCWSLEPSLRQCISDSQWLCLLCRWMQRLIRSILVLRCYSISCTLASWIAKTPVLFWRSCVLFVKKIHSSCHFPHTLFEETFWLRWFVSAFSVFSWVCAWARSDDSKVVFA